VRLKIFTTFSMVAVLVLLALSATLLGPVPNRSAPRQVKRVYGVRALAYLGTMIVLFGASGVGSYLIFKKAKDEYREESLNNLKMLVAGAQQESKQEPSDSGGA